MLVVMKSKCSPEEIAGVESRIRSLGFTPHPIPGSNRLAFGITGNAGPVDPLIFSVLPGVAEAIRVTQPFKLVSREVKNESTIVSVGDVKIGGGHVAIIAGPCAVESREQILAAAHAVKASGAVLLRGGAYKPRTSCRTRRHRRWG